MITENLSTLKIHKLTQEQYRRELEAGRVDINALYLTPDDANNIYVQNSEPIGAEDGSLWVDLDEEGSYIDNSNNSNSIPNYVKAEAERVAKIVQSRQNANTITFLACSDIHYTSPNNATPISSAQNIHEATIHMGQAMEIIGSQVHIDFAVMFGDMIRDNGEQSVDEVQAEVRFVNSCLNNGFSGIPSIRLEGNHEDAYSCGVGLSASQVFANIHSWNSGVVYGERSIGYCYRDFEDVKLRVICLNTSEYSGTYFNVSNEQNQWLAEVLDLSEKGDDWRSVILSHHPLDFQRSGGANLIPTVSAATGLIGTFHGHIHNFLVDNITGTEVKRIAIPNAVRDQEDSYNTVNGVNFNEGTKYRKTVGTAEDTSFCVVTIDLAEHKIYADHYGAGYDRVIEYEDDAAKYTNLVKSAVAYENNDVYNNGLGYKDDYRISTSATNYEGTGTGFTLTGYIPYTVPASGLPKPIYIKGLSWTAESNCRMNFFGIDKKVIQSPQIVGNSTAEANMLTTYFTIENLGDNYCRLTPVADGSSSKINTVYSGAKNTAYIRFSLKGIGADLIITVDEPIE